MIHDVELVGGPADGHSLTLLQLTRYIEVPVGSGAARYERGETVGGTTFYIVKPWEIEQRGRS